MNVRLTLILILAALVLAGCAALDGAPAFVPLPPTRTAALPPTITPTATHTPVPPTPTLIPSPTETATPAATPTTTPAVLMGAGDIALCGDGPEYAGDEQSASIIETQIAQYPHARVFIAGDTVQGEGAAWEYERCLDPTWGRFKERIRPAPGNHDYMTTGAGPYYDYFGEAAGPRGVGYYSYDLGDWHIAALNSNCADVGCGPESEQVAWLRADLAASEKQCTLVYWHHPRFSSGLTGGTGTVNPFWRTVTEMGVEIVVNGHDHNYERFAPMDSEGNAAPNGTRLFVSGTGGAHLRRFSNTHPSSELRLENTHGILQFRLYPGRYAWTFLPADDPTLTDAGEGACQ
jgi:alkaline phosphatase